MKHDDLPPDARLLARQLDQAMDAQLKGELNGYAFRNHSATPAEVKAQYIADIAFEFQAIINETFRDWEARALRTPHINDKTW